MKVLVTGSAGFIGSHVVDELIKNGHDVYGMDNLSVGSIDNVNPKSKFFKIELSNKEAVDVLMSQIKPEAVVHCAAWAHEGLSQFSPHLITENNLGIFLKVLVPAIKYGMKKLVLFSSIASYGSLTPPFTEDMDLKPVDIYGINKMTMEKMASVLSDIHDFEYTTVRPFNVYGPRQSLADPYRNVIGIWMNKLLKDESYYIYGDGEQSRAFSYVGDIVPIIANLVHKGLHKEIFNIGAEKQYSLNELSAALRKAAGKTGVNFEPRYLNDRPGEVKHAYSDVSKAKKYLGFEDKTTLEEGIKNMWDWAVVQGPQTPIYFDDAIEIDNEKVPMNWKKRI